VRSKSKLVNGFIIGTFVSLYLMVSVISTIHVIDFFKLSNPTWLAISLAVAFEVGAAASLASLIAMEKMNKSLVWFLFILLTAMQAMGNTYYAFVNLGDYTSWSELFGLIEEEEIFQKRVLAMVSGAILPIVALGFIKSLVDYIKPDENDSKNSEAKTDEPTTFDQEKDKDQDLEDFDKLQNISEPLKYDDTLDLVELPRGKLELEDMITGDSAEDVEPKEEKKPISRDNIEIVNVNSNKSTLKKVDMPTNPDVNPTRL